MRRYWPRLTCPLLRFHIILCVRPAAIYRLKIRMRKAPHNLERNRWSSDLRNFKNTIPEIKCSPCSQSCCSNSKAMSKHNQAFTLVELLVVIAIIGI